MRTSTNKISSIHKGITEYFFCHASHTELLRITRHHSIPEEVVGVIEELAYAIHDATVAIRTTMRSISVR
jgi:hypothetical protein